MRQTKARIGVGEGAVRTVRAKVLHALRRSAYAHLLYRCHDCRLLISRNIRTRVDKEKTMKTLVLSISVALGAVCAMATAAVADTTAGTFVKDSTITTKVKAKLAEKHMSTLTDIKVDTDKDGVVWLSGQVPTKDAKDLAEMITKDTEGVSSVHNSIVIR
jgi:hyperosmotically inducible protein